MPEKVITIASTTSSQAELEHATGENWREPFVKPEEKEESEPAEGKTETESEPVTTEQKPERQKGESHSGWQKRVDRLTARNKQVEARAAELEAELNSIKSKQTTTTAQPAKPAAKPGEPRIEDFENVNDWFDARADWKRERERQAEQSTAKQQETRELWDAHNNRLSEARAKYDDFDEISKTFGDITIPQSAALAIVEQPNSADIVYYLANHTEEAKNLNDLRPMQAIAAIARISDKLKAPSAPKPKPSSQAPQPIRPVGSGATGSNVEPGQMSYQDYKRYRAAR
jgi:hypothetical protein